MNERLMSSDEDLPVRDVYSIEVAGPYKNFLCGDYLLANSHACAYASLAYESAYLKTHFTEEYWAAWLNAHPPVRQRQTIGEIHLREVRMLPPDIRMAGDRFTAVAEGVVAPLTLIERLGKKAHAVIRERCENGPYEHLADCRRRLGALLGAAEWAALAQSGALDGLAGGRRAAVEHLQLTLPPGATAGLTPPPNARDSVWMEIHWRRSMEQAACGAAFTPHPLRALRPYLDACGAHTIRECLDNPSSRSRKIALTIIRSDAEQITGEDETGVIHLAGRLDAAPGTWWLAEVEHDNGRWRLTDAAPGEKTWRTKEPGEPDYAAICTQRLLTLYATDPPEAAQRIAPKYRRLTRNDAAWLARWEAVHDPFQLAERIAEDMLKGSAHGDAGTHLETEEARWYFWLKGARRLLRRTSASEDALDVFLERLDQAPGPAEKLTGLRLAAEQGWMRALTGYRLVRLFAAVGEPKLQIQVLAALNGNLSFAARRALIAEVLDARAVETRWWFIKHFHGLTEHETSAEERERMCARLQAAFHETGTWPETDAQTALKRLADETPPPFRDIIDFELARRRAAAEETNFLNRQQLPVQPAKGGNLEPFRLGD